MSNDAAQPLAQRRNYSSVGNAFTRIVAEEGPSAFFRGVGPFVNRAMLVGAVQVGTYDQFRETFRDAGVHSEVLRVFYASMSSGLIYSIVTMPFERCVLLRARAWAGGTAIAGKLLLLLHHFSQCQKPHGLFKAGSCDRSQQVYEHTSDDWGYRVARGRHEAVVRLPAIVRRGGARCHIISRAIVYRALSSPMIQLLALRRTLCIHV